MAMGGFPSTVVVPKERFSTPRGRAQPLAADTAAIQPAARSMASTTSTSLPPPTAVRARKDPRCTSG